MTHGTPVRSAADLLAAHPIGLPKQHAEGGTEEAPTLSSLPEGVVEAILLQLRQRQRWELQPLATWSLPLVLEHQHQSALPPPTHSSLQVQFAAPGRPSLPPHPPSHAAPACLQGPCGAGVPAVGRHCAHLAPPLAGGGSGGLAPSFPLPGTRGELPGLAHSPVCHSAAADHHRAEGRSGRAHGGLGELHRSHRAAGATPAAGVLGRLCTWAVLLRLVGIACGVYLYLQPATYC